MAHPARTLPASFADAELDRLLAEARQAWSDGNLRWAEALARRARCFDPRSIEAAKLQCTLLRKLGRIEQAMAITEQFADARDRELSLMRSRLACDLERWDEARTICDAIDEPPPALVNRIRLAAGAV